MVVLPLKSLDQHSKVNLPVHYVSEWAVFTGRISQATRSFKVLKFKFTFIDNLAS